MISKIVDSRSAVTLVGGGALNPTDLQEAHALAPCLVAADGGADRLLAEGLEPEAVIGDFDSISDRARARVPEHRQHRIDEQDSTDFDKALRHIAAPLVIGVGFLGARLDHQLAALNVLGRHADRRCVLIGAAEIVFVAPPILSLDLDAGSPVSLFPLTSVSGRSTGLEWPIDGLDFAPKGRVGTSNRAVGPVELQMDGPGMLVMAPRHALEQTVMALMSAPDGWPAL